MDNTLTESIMDTIHALHAEASQQCSFDIDKIREILPITPDVRDSLELMLHTVRQGGVSAYSVINKLNKSMIYQYLDMSRNPSRTNDYHDVEWMTTLSTTRLMLCYLAFDKDYLLGTPVPTIDDMTQQQADFIIRCSSSYHNEDWFPSDVMDALLIVVSNPMFRYHEEDYRYFPYMKTWVLAVENSYELLKRDISYSNVLINLLYDLQKLCRTGSDMHYRSMIQYIIPLSPSSMPLLTKAIGSSEDITEKDVQTAMIYMSSLRAGHYQNQKQYMEETYRDLCIQDMLDAPELMTMKPSVIRAVLEWAWFSWEYASRDYDIKPDERRILYTGYQSMGIIDLSESELFELCDDTTREFRHEYMMMMDLKPITMKPWSIRTVAASLMLKIRTMVS